MAEVKEYVSVSEKNFWRAKTLELTLNGRVLNNDLKGIVESKIASLNAKLDAAYNVSGMNMDKWQNKISEQEWKRLALDLKKIIQWFNEVISQMESEYLWKTWENTWKIRTEISEFFSDKNIFLVKRASWIQALAWYAMWDPLEALVDVNGSSKSYLQLN